MDSPNRHSCIFSVVTLGWCHFRIGNPSQHRGVIEVSKNDLLVHEEMQQGWLKPEVIRFSTWPWVYARRTDGGKRCLPLFTLLACIDGGIEDNDIWVNSALLNLVEQPQRIENKQDFRKAYDSETNDGIKTAFVFKEESCSLFFSTHNRENNNEK